MHFTYCPHCGTKAILKEIGDEGFIPYCDACRTPLWDMFTTSIICAVINEENEIALLRQDYVSTSNLVCVAGIMKQGESAEETVIREVKEELGLDVEELAYIRSYPYNKKEMLMLGFRAQVRKQDFSLSGEGDDAQWVPLSEAPDKLREVGVAWQLVRKIIGDQ